jgi:hypothetical protein
VELGLVPPPEGDLELLLVGEPGLESVAPAPDLTGVQLADQDLEDALPVLPSQVDDARVY